MTSTTSSDSSGPQLVALGMIATPLLFFSILAVIGPLGHFALYLLLAWKLAAGISIATLVADRDVASRFSVSERLAMLAANGLVALMVATFGFAAFGLH